MPVIISKRTGSYFSSGKSSISYNGPVASRLYEITTGHHIRFYRRMRKLTAATSIVVCFDLSIMADIEELMRRVADNAELEVVQEADRDSDLSESELDNLQMAGKAVTTQKATIWGLKKFTGEASECQHCIYCVGESPCFAGLLNNVQNCFY
jgi:hypothetical protein